MKNIFDITEYGAVGDGVTDCTPAVQTALDDAGKCRGTVYVPPGTYLTGTLRMHAGTALKGEAAWSFRSDGASVLLMKDADGDCLIDITDAFGCSVSGVCLNGGGLGENIHGIMLQRDKYNGGGEEDTPTVDNCRIGNFSGDGIHLDHIWCFSVRHSMLHRNRGAGLYIDGWDGFIIDNWLTANKHGGMCGGGAASSVTATGNRVEWNDLAGFYLPNTNCCNFTGNYFDRSRGPALVLGTDEGSASSVSVTGNMIYRSGKPYEDAEHKYLSFDDPYDSSHIRITNGDNIVISGNSFRLGQDDDGKGFYSPDYVAVIRKSHHSILRDNIWANGCIREGFLSLEKNHEVEISGNVGVVGDWALSCNEQLPGNINKEIGELQ